MYRLILVVLSLLLISCGSKTSSSPVQLHSIRNINDISLSEEALKGIEDNGFIVTETAEDDMYEVYSKLAKRKRPVFVTTDIVLHTNHLLFDYILRIIEIHELHERVAVLSEGLLNELTGIHGKEKLNDFEQQALERTIGFFALPCKILSIPVHLPKSIEQKVTSELQLIEKAEGFAQSPLFDIKEDYSQYKPRGHYTRNETLKNYFKVMMWFGRMPFYLKPPSSAVGFENQEEMGKNLTLSALYITYVLENNSLLYDTYKSIYEITSFLVGESDDLTPFDYSTLLKEVYGAESGRASLSIDHLLAAFISRAQEKPAPSIVSGVLLDTETDTFPRSFKFMGQRFIPDSYIFQNLVYDRVTR
ncbi:MAG: DUF3160 domain-containing protein, partial [Candidatus Cloacimonadota bacterium]